MIWYDCIHDWQKNYFTSRKLTLIMQKTLFACQSHFSCPFYKYNHMTNVLHIQTCVWGVCVRPLPGRSPLRSAVCGVCRVLLVSHQHTHACKNTFLQTDKFLFPDQSIYRASYCKCKNTFIMILTNPANKEQTHIWTIMSKKSVCILPIWYTGK